MLLQTQARWYKTVLYLLILALGWLSIASGMYIIRWKWYEKDINKEVLTINDIRKQIQTAKLSKEYKIYQMWDYILKENEITNYVALYEYLNQVKNAILKDLKNYTISRFILAIKPEEITIDTTLPNYEVLYTSWGMINLISKRDFVKQIEANSFRNVPNGINVKLKIRTK